MSYQVAMSYQKVKVAQDGDVTIITLSDPATMNAAGLDMVGELQHALKQAVMAAKPARAILLTGEGRGFCSGANLQAGPGARDLDGDGKPDAGGALETAYNPLVTFMREMPVPLVTAVNGAAAGVGCSLALLGALIVARESAYFLQAFRRIGLVPDRGPTYLLPRSISRARAIASALLGERLPGAQAHGRGRGELAQIGADAERENEVRAAILPGAGWGSSAGGDFDRIRAIIDVHAVRARVLREAGGIDYNFINCSKPIVSAIRGQAVG